MKISFWKMHGAKNDFIVVDDRNLKFPTFNKKWIKNISSRRSGIGCEGIILIQPSIVADFRMHFINPDGNEASMCGNGARCAARLAYDIGIAQAFMRIETGAGILFAEIRKSLVRIEMTAPHSWQIDKKITVEGKVLQYSVVNTGVPHVLLFVDDISSCDIKTLGSTIRFHEKFSPEGANVNFINISGRHKLSIRTYERGVEDETLACGTGVVAAALIAAKQNKVSVPVNVLTAGGDTLSVDFVLTPTGAESVFLEGPAVCVYKGELEMATERSS